MTLINVFETYSCLKVAYLSYMIWIVCFNNSWFLLARFRTRKFVLDELVFKMEVIKSVRFQLNFILVYYWSMLFHDVWYLLDFRIRYLRMHLLFLKFLFLLIRYSDHLVQRIIGIQDVFWLIICLGINRFINFSLANLIWLAHFFGYRLLIIGFVVVFWRRFLFFFFGMNTRIILLFLETCEEGA